MSRLFGVFLVKNAQKQYSKSTQQQNYKKEGDIHIKTNPKDNKKHVQGGDYVDFEEVE